MANRFSQISTSAFDPLSLNEIMAVPLAKQQQQDALLQGTSEVSAIDSQRLAGNDEAVTEELEGLRSRSRQLSKEILEGGYNRSIRNRFNELKMDQATAFSSKGVVGKAQINYDKRQANIKAVLSNKQLTPQQQQAGLNYALNQFNQGAGETYVDYTGAQKIDVKKMALDVGSKMKPQQIADSLGITWDERGQVYRDGTYEYQTLPPERIAKAVSQYMMNDETVASYMLDMQKIGLISNPQNYIQNAAIDAGNILAVENKKLTNKVMSEKYMKRVTDNTSGVLDMTNAGWGSRPMQSRVTDSVERLSIDIDSDDYDDSGNFVTEAGYFFGASDEDLADYKTKVASYRRRNNFGAEVSDKAIAELVNGAIKDSSMFYSQVFNPLNREHSAWYTQDRMFGTKEGEMGDAWASRAIRVDGMPGIESLEQLADKLDLTGPELNEILRKSSMLGFATGDPDLPMGAVFSFHADPDDEATMNITVANDTEVSSAFNEPSTLISNMQNGIEFQSQQTIGENGETVYNNYILDTVVEYSESGVPIGMKYEPKLVITDHKYNSIEEYDAGIKVETDYEEILLSKLMGDNAKEYQEYLGGVAQGKKSNKQ